MANSKCNESYIREAAYYLWQNAGCPMGQDEKFWSMAVEQISSCKCSSSKCCSSSKKSSSSSCSKSSSAKKSASKK